MLVQDITAEVTSRKATPEISQLRSGWKRGERKIRPERTAECLIAPGVLSGHKVFVMFHQIPCVWANIRLSLSGWFYANDSFHLFRLGGENRIKIRLGSPASA